MVRWPAVPGSGPGAGSSRLASLAPQDDGWHSNHGRISGTRSTSAGSARFLRTAAAAACSRAYPSTLLRPEHRLEAVAVRISLGRSVSLGTPGNAAGTPVHGVSLDMVRLRPRRGRCRAIRRRRGGGLSMVDACRGIALRCSLALLRVGGEHRRISRRRGLGRRLRRSLVGPRHVGGRLPVRLGGRRDAVRIALRIRRRLLT